MHIRAVALAVTLSLVSSSIAAAAVCDQTRTSQAERDLGREIGLAAGGRMPATGIWNIQSTGMRRTSSRMAWPTIGSSHSMAQPIIAEPPSDGITITTMISTTLLPTGQISLEHGFFTSSDLTKCKPPVPSTTRMWRPTQIRRRGGEISCMRVGTVGWTNTTGITDLAPAINVGRPGIARFRTVTIFISTGSELTRSAPCGRRTEPPTVFTRQIRCRSNICAMWRTFHNGGFPQAFDKQHK